MKVVILAAGLGTRLWPLSTPNKPKQFQKLINGQSLLHYTYATLATVIPTSDLYVQTLKGLEKHVYEELPEINDEHVILVPEHRDTLAETLWTINTISRDGSEAILFKSVDQYIENSSDFALSLKSSIENYDHLDMTLFGIPAGQYSSNSGYLTIDNNGVVTSFIEKPSLEVTLELLKTNKLYRSLFIYSASYGSVEKSLERLDTPWARASKALLKADEDTREQLFLSMPIIDISTTLFEAADNLKFKLLDKTYKYVDVGRYSALYDLNDKDRHGNVIIGQVKTGLHCHNNLIINHTDDPLVVIDTSNSVIIQTNEGDLVSTFEASGNIKEIYKNQLYPK
jgi:mannose-1-phosphate guanylyltransferase